MITRSREFSLLGHNTFGIASTCREWVEYTDVADLPELMTALEGSRYFSIGAGSNLILPAFYDGTVLHSCITDVDCSVDNNGRVTLYAGAGCTLDTIVELSVERGWWGLENLSAIPGTVGASVVQNVGAYGIEAADVVAAVECYDTLRKELITLSGKDCRFGYRDSMFKHNKGRYVVTHVTYILSLCGGPVLDYGNLRGRLSDTDEVTPATVRRVITDLRHQKLPEPGVVGSAGSFFKNPVIDARVFAELEIRLQSEENGNGSTDIPHHYLSDGRVKIPAAWLIDRCGFKGLVHGTVGVWPRQPLVLYNATGDATAADVKKLETLIVEKVKHIFGISLSAEVEYIK